MNPNVHTALIQMDIQIGEPDVNFDRVVQKLTEAVKQPQKPDLIVLPEMWNTGYALESIRALADKGGVRTKSILGEFARMHNVMIVGGSIAEKRGEHVYNTMFVFDREGREIGCYRKIHLFRLMDEHIYLQSGGGPGNFELEGIPSGGMICYDIRFPELARSHALEGVKLLIIPAQWPHPRLHHWRTLLQARAIENQLYVLACNRCGASGDTRFFGHSMVIDPWGEILAEAGEEEQILYAGMDLHEVDKVRQKIPVFRDRRPEYYQRWSEADSEDMEQGTST